MLEDQHAMRRRFLWFCRHHGLNELGPRDVALQMGQYVDFLEYQGRSGIRDTYGRDSLSNVSEFVSP